MSLNNVQDNSRIESHQNAAFVVNNSTEAKFSNSLHSSWQQTLKFASCVELNHTSDNLRFRAYPGWPVNHNRFLITGYALDQSSEDKPKSKSEEGNLGKRNKKEKKKISKPPSEHTSNQNIKEMFSENQIISASDEVLFGWATGDKTSALSLQEVIDSCAEICLERLSNFGEHNLSELIIHKFGSYTVQRLMARNPGFQEIVINYCQARIDFLASNDFASRVMQHLVQSSHSFRSFALGYAQKDIYSFVKDFSSVFFVSAAIIASDNEIEKDILTNKLAKQPKKWLANKYFKRLLVAYIQTCGQAGLDQVFDILRKQVQLSDILKDKYLTLVLLAFLERSYRPVEQDILLQLRSDLLGTLEMKYFLYLLTQVVNRTPESSYIWRLSQELSNPSPVAAKALQLDPVQYQRYSAALWDTWSRASARKSLLVCGPVREMESPH